MYKCYSYNLRINTIDQWCFDECTEYMEIGGFNVHIRHCLLTRGDDDVEQNAFLNILKISQILCSASSSFEQTPLLPLTNPKWLTMTKIDPEIHKDRR